MEGLITNGGAQCGIIVAYLPYAYTMIGQTHVEWLGGITSPPKTMTQDAYLEQHKMAYYYANDMLGI